ncbi:MAG TPA: ABC transporter permease [Candidatus Limnocylindrales bacterium]|nr:ABC transporter permease [Candidatus Limnocylindrales bacterium]
MLSSLYQDIRYAIRMLAKNPGFTLVAVLTLALGIGANTAIFSLVNAFLLRPLPFPDSRQLVIALGRTSQVPRTPISCADFEDWRSRTHSFSELSLWQAQSVNLTGKERPQRVRGSFVSANFFQMLGINPAMGRDFLPGEDQPGADRVAILNYSLWKNRFAADPELIGKRLTLNGAVFTVVGILPADFEFPLDTDRIEIWLPITSFPTYSQERKDMNFIALGRMNPGVTLAQAQADLSSVAHQLAKEYPDQDGQRDAVVLSLQGIINEDLRPLLLVLFAAVGFVLLIACANVANLLLARSAARSREMALRAALGAARPRLMRQMLTETLLLWAGGAALGIVTAYWALHALLATPPVDLPPGIGVQLDETVFAFTCLTALITGVISGILPALHSSKPDLNQSLKAGGGVSGESAGPVRMRALLLVSQVACSLILLAAAGLMIRTIVRLAGVDPGFQAKNVLSLEYRLPKTKYSEGAQQWNFHRQVVDQVSALPGVRSAALAQGIPFSGNDDTEPYILLDRPQPPPGQEPVADFNVADSHFFATLGIPLIEGRTFSESDQAGTPRVAVINRTMARKFWPESDPIGKQLELLDEKKPATIVGVVGDIRQRNLHDPAPAQVYLAYPQNSDIFATLIVRTEGEPMPMANAVRQVIWSIDSDQPMWKVRSLESLLAKSMGDRRYLAFLLSIYSGLALFLAAVGIYGVLSYGVSRRGQEIGVRMALGAQPGDVLRLVVRQGMTMVLIGVALGCAGAMAAGHLISTLLFGVSPTDPVTFAASILVLAAAAFAACYLPARRATRVDPMVALRYE